MNIEQELAREARVLDWLEQMVLAAENSPELSLEAWIQRAPSEEELIRAAWNEFQGSDPWQLEDLPRRVGEYTLIERIGHGGSSRVYRATSPWGAEVAIKILDPVSITTPVAIARFHREIRIAAAIDHPALVPILDHGSVGGQPSFFLVTPLAESGTLKDRLLREGPLSDRSIRMIAASLLTGLSALHERGLIHRDVKPENVLCFQDGSARLADFGLARSTAAEETSLTAPGEGPGTAAYSAPEQKAGLQDIDIRADLYSLGRTLSACLAAVPGRASSDAGPALRAFIAALLEVDRDRRPADPASALALLGENAPQLSSLGDGLKMPIAQKPFYAGPRPRETIAAGEAVAPVLVLHRLEIERRGKRQALDIHAGNILKLGRQAAADTPQELQIPGSFRSEFEADPRVISRWHLVFRIGDDEVTCTDLGSARGTRVFGQRLEAHEPFGFDARAEFDLSGAIQLVARVTRVRQGQRPALRLWESRRGEEHSVALVPEELALDDVHSLVLSGAALSLLPRGGAPVRLEPGAAVTAGELTLRLLGSFAARSRP